MNPIDRRCVNIGPVQFTVLRSYTKFRDSRISFILVTALSFTDIFASFLAGRWADKFTRVSYLLLSLTLTEVIASVLYLVARECGIQFNFLPKKIIGIHF